MLEIDKNTVAEAAENTENIAAETAETDIAAGADIVTDALAQMPRTMRTKANSPSLSAKAKSL